MEAIGSFSTAQIVVALFAALGASFIRGLTGFGMAILLVPIMALALPPVEAVLIANGLSVLIGLSELPRLLRGAERSAWAIAGLCMVVTPAGLLALAATGADLARFIIALIALSAFVAVLIPRLLPDQPGIATIGTVGILSGLMTGYAGMPGPPVVPFYVSRSLPRETAKTSMLLIFTFAAGAGLVSGAAIGVATTSLALLTLLLFPAVLVGNWLGNKASGTVSDPVWRISVGVVLGAAALAALIRLL
ncbi:MAG: sulfite exporter TauE/SafE family protein [Pseudomonadota bacterium]|nr:sulfite exporter TauE/SafE family protein [Pseudomonadota bacterium]